MATLNLLPAGTLRTIALAAAAPAAGWAAHALYLHRCLAQAGRDPVTGLLRRDGFTRRARRLVARHGDDVMVILLDLDHFKALNDTLGHAAGDQVLADVGLRLQFWTGHDGAAGRLGGDEFALVLARPRAQHVRELAVLAGAMNVPVRISGADVDVALSIGAAAPALLPGVQGLSALLRAADAAMYEGKHTGSPVLAGPEHAAVRSVNGRRAGRPGTDQLTGAAT